MKRIILILISIITLCSYKTHDLSYFYTTITDTTELKGPIKDFKGYSCSIENTKPFVPENLIYSVQFSAPSIPVSKFESHCCSSTNESYTWKDKKLIQIDGKYDDGSTYVKQISYDSKNILVLYISNNYFSKTFYHLDGHIESNYVKGDNSFIEKD